jgi:hypothetical protein
MPPGCVVGRGKKIKLKIEMSEKYIGDPRSTPGDGFPEIS